MNNANEQEDIEVELKKIIPKCEFEATNETKILKKEYHDTDEIRQINQH